MMLLCSEVYADNCQKIDNEAVGDAVKTFKLTNDEMLTIETYGCVTGTGNSAIPYSTFHWPFSKKNQPIQKGIYFDKNKPDASGIVGQSIELMNNNTIVIDEMAERGGVLNLLHWNHNKQLIAYKFDYVGGDDDGLCVSATGKDLINVQRCSYDGKKTKNFGEVLKLKISKDKISVTNPKVLPTFTDWRKMPKP